jgi:hypothetical protein
LVLRRCRLTPRCEEKMPKQTLPRVNPESPVRYFGC